MDIEIRHVSGCSMNTVTDYESTFVIIIDNYTQLTAWMLGSSMYLLMDCGVLV